MPSYCYRLFYHEFQKSEMQQTFFLQLGTSLHIIRQKYLFDMLKTLNEPLYENTSPPFPMTRNIYFKTLFGIETTSFFKSLAYAQKQ